MVKQEQIDEIHNNISKILSAEFDQVSQWMSPSSNSWVRMHTLVYDQVPNSSLSFTKACCTKALYFAVESDVNKDVIIEEGML